MWEGFYSKHCNLDAMKKGLINGKNDDIYEKDIYVINVKQVYNDLYQRIEQEIIKDGGIGKERLELLESEFDFYCSKIKIKKKLPYAPDLKQYELKTTHPSFYKWLGFALTAQDYKSIVMQLQAYAQGSYGEVNNFNKTIEFQVIKFMAFMPFPHSKQDHAVERWIISNNYQGEKQTLEHISPLLQLNGSKLKSLFFISEVQEYLKSTFVDYLENQEQRALFITIMEGYFLKDPEKITLKLKANVFCDVIKQIKDGDVLNITSNKKLINEWICSNFLFDQKGIAKAVSPSYCTQLLAGRETPSDGIRIIYKPTVK
jgi:hypothetical protein